MKGKRGLATKTTSKKKKQRIADNPALTTMAPIPDVSVIAADLIQAIQVLSQLIPALYS
jgi:hypothetical protein